MSMENRKLPEGWKWVKLGDVCRIASGSTPQTGVAEYWNGDICWVTPTDLGKLRNLEIYDSARKITKAGYDNSGTELISPGSVVLSSRAPIGHLGIAKVSLCTNQGCKSFVPGPNIETSFLYFALKISVKALQSLGSGATFTEVSKSQVENFEIPLPPLPEQKRIAAILNEQMGAVEKARAAAEARLEAAKALPAAYLREVFNGSQSQLWPSKKFEEVAFLQRGYDLPSSQQVIGAYPIITSSGNTGTHIEYRAKGPGVITGRSGSLGKVHFVEGDYWPHNTALFVKDFRGNEPRFIFYLLQWIGLKDVGSGSGVPTLDRKQVHKLEVRCPSIKEQKHIAEILNEQMAEADKLRKKIEDELEAIQSLPSAILRRAFNGEI